MKILHLGSLSGHGLPAEWLCFFFYGIHIVQLTALSDYVLMAADMLILKMAYESEPAGEQSNELIGSEHGLVVSH